MSQVNVTFRMDSALKESAEAVFQNLGMSLSHAITIFLKQSVQQQSLPFSASESKPNLTTLAAMEEAEKAENLIGPFTNVDDLMRSLNA